MKSNIRSRKTARPPVVSFIALALIAIVFQSSSYAYVQFSDPNGAGGFVFAHWPTLPLNYTVDNGPAPDGFTEATLVTPAFDAWKNVATSNVDFVRQPNNSGDANWEAADFGITWGDTTDNNFEVMFDDDGDLLNQIAFGILGIGFTTVDTTTGEIVDAFLILNTDTTIVGTSDLLATTIHEAGHTIGLAHSFVGAQDNAIEFGLADASIPTMYPFEFPNDDTQGRTLEFDDISSVSRIYPETADNPPTQVPWGRDTGRISGYVLKGNNGSFARGVHVRAINISNPNIQIACLSDYKGDSTGEFLIEGVPPGEYRVIIEGIDGRGGINPNRIEDDGIGGPGNAYSGFADDFFANPESNSEPTNDFVRVRVYPDWRTSAVYVVTNEGNNADLTVRPWGGEDHPIHDPWYGSSDIYVDNDGDGIHNENGEPAHIANNQLSAIVRNIGNQRSMRYRVVFSFSALNSAGESTPQQITSIDMDPLDPGASVTVGPVNWDLSPAGLASLPPEFQMTDHYCVKVWVEKRDGDPQLIDADPLNNLARSNFGIAPTDPSGGRTRFMAVNTEARPAVAKLLISRMPKGWRVIVDDVEVTKETPLGRMTHEFVMQPNQHKLVNLQAYPTSDFFLPAAPGQQSVDISQFINGRVVGGLTTNFVDVAKFPAFSLASLTLSPASVAGGSCQTSTGRVTLNGVAPPGGAMVTLTNTNPAASMPASVTIPAGTSTQTFTITTAPVAATKSGVVTARLNAVSRSATLNVLPIGVQSVSLTPNPVLGGNNVTGTVTLECAAAPGNILVTLATNNSSVAKPAVTSIVIPAGVRTMNFTVTTTRPLAVRTATITATANGKTGSRVLTVNP